MNNFTLKFEAYLPLFWQLFRYGIVGLTAATVHFCIVVLVVQNIGINPLIANLFAFLFSFQVSYLGHRRWTFNDTETLHRDAYPKLVMMQIVNMTISEVLFYIFLSMNYPYPIALIIVLGILPFFSFVISRTLIFKS